MFNNIYKNKKVLITGHTGFKGSWLTLWLLLLGAKVIGYSLPPNTNPNLFSELKLSKEIIDIRGDIRDIKKIKKIIKKYKPDIIFHLAAQPIVKISYENPIETIETNILGTSNLLEASKNYNFIKGIINVTSDKCYLNKESIFGYRETDKLGGFDPYSASKACSEILTSAYRKSFFKDKKTLISSVRAGNVIGGGDWSKFRIIPDCIKSITKNKDIIIRNPSSIRPWQFVLEPLSGYLQIGSVA